MDPFKDLPVFHPEILPEYKSRDDFVRDIENIESKRPFTQLTIKDGKVVRQIRNPFRELYDFFQERQGKYSRTNPDLIKLNLLKMQRAGTEIMPELEREKPELAQKFFQRITQSNQEPDHLLKQLPSSFQNLSRENILTIQSTVPVFEKLNTELKSREKISTRDPAIMDRVNRTENLLQQLREISQRPYDPDNRKKLGAIKIQAEELLTDLHEVVDYNVEQTENTETKLYVVNCAIHFFTDKMFEYQNLNMVLLGAKDDEHSYRIREYNEELKLRLGNYAKNMSNPSEFIRGLETKNVESIIKAMETEQLELMHKYKPHKHADHLEFSSPENPERQVAGEKAYIPAVPSDYSFIVRGDCVSILQNEFIKYCEAHEQQPDFEALLQGYGNLGMSAEDWNYLVYLSEHEKQKLFEDKIEHPEKSWKEVIETKLEPRQILLDALDNRVPFDQVEEKLDLLSARTEALIDQLETIANEPENPENSKKLKEISEESKNIEAQIEHWVGDEKTQKVKYQLWVAVQAVKNFANTFEEHYALLKTHQLILDASRDKKIDYSYALSKYGELIRNQRVLLREEARYLAQPQTYFDGSRRTILVSTETYGKKLVPSRMQKEEESSNSSEITLEELKKFYDPKEILEAILVEGGFSKLKAQRVSQEVADLSQTDWNAAYGRIAEVLQSPERLASKTDCRIYLKDQIKEAYPKWVENQSVEGFSEGPPEMESMLRDFPSEEDFSQEEWNKLADLPPNRLRRGLQELYRTGAKWGSVKTSWKEIFSNELEKSVRRPTPTLNQTPLGEIPLKKEDVQAIQSSMHVLLRLREMLESKEEFVTSGNDSSISLTENMIKQLEEISRHPYDPSNSQKLLEIKKESAELVEKLSEVDSKNDVSRQLIVANTALAAFADSYLEVQYYRKVLQLFVENKAENLVSLEVFVNEKEVELENYASYMAHPQKYIQTLTKEKRTPDALTMSIFERRGRLIEQHNPDALMAKGLEGIGFSSFQANRIVSETVEKIRDVGYEQAFQVLNSAITNKAFMANSSECVARLNIDLTGFHYVYFSEHPDERVSPYEAILEEGLETISDRDLNELADLPRSEKKALALEKIKNPRTPWKIILEQALKKD